MGALVHFAPNDDLDQMRTFAMLRLLAVAKSAYRTVALVRRSSRHVQPSKSATTACSATTGHNSKPPRCPTVPR